MNGGFYLFGVGASAALFLSNQSLYGSLLISSLVGLRFGESVAKFHFRDYEVQE